MPCGLIDHHLRQRDIQTFQLLANKFPLRGASLKRLRTSRSNASKPPDIFECRVPTFLDELQQPRQRLARIIDLRYAPQGPVSGGHLSTRPLPFDIAIGPPPSPPPKVVATHHKTSVSLWFYCQRWTCTHSIQTSQCRLAGSARE